jgi:hypothetical protein
VTWLGILRAAMMAASAFAGWLRDRQLIEAGKAEAVATHLKCALDEIAKANEARDSVRRAVEREPLGLRDDDGFKRPD